MAPEGAPRERIVAIDAARGTALVLMLASHFGSVYFRSPAHDSLRSLLADVGMIATPTFVIVSGLLLGFLYRTSGYGFDHLRVKLIDRGAFLLLVGHALIWVSFLPSAGPIPISFSTDAIAAALIVGPMVIPHTSGRTRLALGACAYLISWAVTLAWRPAGWGANFVEEIIVGNLTHTVFRWGTFPILPWIGVYLASSVYGERFGLLYKNRQLQRVIYELGIAGILMIAAMSGIKLVMVGLHSSERALWLADRMHAVLRIGQKYPPGPGYFLFYGGFALSVLSVCVAWDVCGVARRALKSAAILGEASLAIFIGHFYVFWLGIYFVSSGSLALAPLYFTAALGLMMLLAIGWRRARGNDLVTVGFTALARATSRKDLTMATSATVN